jgi:hypothetical protein
MQEPEQQRKPLPAWKVSEPYRVAHFPILSLLGMLSGFLCLGTALLAGFVRPAFGLLSVGFIVGTLLFFSGAGKRGEQGLFRGCGLIGCLLAVGGMGLLALLGFLGEYGLYGR